MTDPMQVFAELFRQLAFISALLGGFALTFVAQLLTAERDRRIVSWTLAFSLLTIAGFLICVLGWTLSAAVVVNTSQKGQMQHAAMQLHPDLSTIFVVSLMLFLISVGLSGWVRSRNMGIISSVIAAITAIACAAILRIFIQRH